MFKSLKWSFIFIGIFFILFLIWWFKYEPFKKEQRPFGVPIDQILIKEQIKDIHELATLELQYADYNEHHWIAKSGLGYKNHKHALVVAAIKIKIGIDLSRSQIIIDSTHKIIKVILTQPQVFDPTFIKRRIYDKLPLNPEDDHPLLDYVVDLTSAESDSLFNQIKMKAIENAKSEENYNRARKNAAAILQGMLQPIAGMNHYQIQIDFRTPIILKDIEVPADTTSLK
jgi:hypothetical protein